MDKLENPNERLVRQQALAEEVARLDRKMELLVSKKYQMSRNIVYGIDNEIHLVEAVKKTLHIIKKLSGNDHIQPKMVD